MKSKFISSAIRIAVITFTAQFILAITPARAQLDETCTVTVNGQTVNVGYGGEFRIRNLPANDNLVRVYAICTKNGKTRYGRSLSFQVLSGQSFALSELDMVWSDTPIPSINSITAVPDQSTLTAIGQTTQIRVTAKLSDGTQAEVTARSKGSTYTSSNPNIARVNGQGVVTAVSSCDVSITVNNDGATSVRIIRIFILVGDPLTTVQGFVRLEDGTPVTGANVTIQNLSASAVTDANGKFSIPGVVTQLGQLTVIAQITLGSQQYFGKISGLNPIPGGFTDAGIITLRPICDPRFAEGLFSEPAWTGGISALAVFDDGTGPALYAGGTFTSAGGVAANRIAKWDGTTWSALGSGVSASFPASVNSLAVFNDGTGPALYAGGEFTMAGGVPINHIAKWDGTAWSPLGSGINSNSIVDALAVFDDGTGSALYAGGVFTTAGGVAANRIAKWNGTAWFPLGSGVNNRVKALAVFDDGTGSALYAAGQFTTAGGVTAPRIAKWNGTAWFPLGNSAINGPVDALAVFNDGTGSALYVTSSFPTDIGAGGKIVRWNGAAWFSFDGFTNGFIRALAVFDDGTGSALYMGGGFTTAGGVTVNSVAKWNATAWLPLGSGMNGGVSAFAVFDDGSGPALFVGGGFTTAGGVESVRIAKWYRPTNCP